MGDPLNDLYSPVRSSGHQTPLAPRNWRKIPIEIHVMDPKWLVIPYMTYGAIHYAVPEQCDENRLRSELYEIIEKSLSIPTPPAGPNRAQILSVCFSKFLTRPLRDLLYPIGLNPIAQLPHIGLVVFGQKFITASGAIELIYDNGINPEFLALI